MTRVFDTLCRKKPQELEEELQQIPEFADATLAKARQVLRLLALFHDIGHTPFSHSGEIAEHHQILSHRTVESAFKNELDTQFFDGCHKLVCELLSKDESKVRQQLLILRSILTGEMDMDRADYLARDSHHCGVRYGVFDHARLVDSLNLTRSRMGYLDLCIERGGFHTVEALLLARYQINLQVYYHRVRRIYDYYLARFLEAWIDTGEMNVECFQRSDDIAVFEAIRKHAADTSSPAHEWARRLFRREHHRMVFESREHEDILGARAVRDLHKAAQAKYPEWDFALDDSGRRDVHQLLVSGDTEEIADIIVLDERTGQTKHIGYASKIIQKIPKAFWVLRIYAYPRTGYLAREDGPQRRRLKEIANWCNSEFAQLRPT